MATPKNATARNTRPARPAKPTMPKMNTPNKKMLPNDVAPGMNAPSRGSASTAKKVKSFIKKYSQGMQ